MNLARLGALLVGSLVAACATIPGAPTREEAASLAPTGKLRVGVYLGNPMSAVRDAGSQQMRGVGFELGQELSRRLESGFEPVVYPSIGALLDGAKSGQWDVALFQINPARSKDFDFTGAIVEIELSFLAVRDSRLSTAADADAPGIRIAVAEKGQPDAILSRTLKSARLVRVPGLAAALQLAKSGDVDAIGAARPSLFELSKQLPGSRVLEGRYATEHVAMAIPKGREPGFAYARRFVEEARAAGTLKAALERAQVRGAVVPAR
jgi:polar amino acid transport system substrate-binding protein